MPDYEHIFGGEDFVVAIGKKLSKKVSEDESIFPASFQITAKMEEQVEVTASQRRQLQTTYIWIPNKKFVFKVDGKCGIGCTADNSDRRKLMTKEQMEVAGKKFLKKFYIAIGRSNEMVNDIKALRLVAKVPEYDIDVDIFYSL
jgi:hypothetical protein